MKENLLEKILNWVKSRFKTTEASPTDVTWGTVFKTVWSWAVRNIMLIAIAYVMLVLLKFEPVSYYLGIKSLFWFSLTILFAGFGLWAYTRNDFIKIFIRGRNNLTDTDNEYKFSTGIMIVMLVVSAYINGKVLDAQSQIENNRMLEPEEIAYVISRQDADDAKMIINKLDSIIKSEEYSK